MCRSEKTASGIARVTERSQIAPARKQILNVALDLSRGLTIALYLNGEEKCVEHHCILDCSR